MSWLFRAPLLLLVLLTALGARGEASLTGPQRQKFMPGWIRLVPGCPFCPSRRPPWLGFMPWR